MDVEGVVLSLNFFDWFLNRLKLVMYIVLILINLDSNYIHGRQSARPQQQIALSGFFLQLLKISYRKLG
jgi:hypothetical protein